MDDLDAMSEAGLGEVFAIEVAGWQRCERPCDWYIPGVGVAQGEPPMFAASADAVMPWLEKPLGFTVTRARVDEQYVVNIWMPEVIGTATTFPRAATIALIRAKRASK